MLAKMSTCPVCGNKNFKVKELLPSIVIETCIGCSFLTSNINRVEPIAPEFSRIDEMVYALSVGQVRERQACEILRIVQQYAPHRGDWIDIGCSFGYMLSEAKRAGYKVFGFEPDESASAKACALVGDDVVQRGFMNDETRADSSADVISMLDVLEHIPAHDLSNFAYLIHRKLRPAGLWVIKVPSTEGLYFTLAHRLLPLSRSLMSGVIKRLWQSEYEYPHTVYFNARTIKLYLENHGFELLTLRYLEDVPNATVRNRLLMDNTISKGEARLIAPTFYIINFIEKLRAKSDAMLILAQRKGISTAI
jgi:SAM-dependent methyltransferase